MELFAAAILGSIQGLTEFLPVSSSAHLILVPWILGWRPEGIVFDVSLHLGTAVAILAFFWKDWVMLAGEVIRGIVELRPLGNPRRRLAWYLVLGTMPAMIVGLKFEKYVEENFRSPLISVVNLIVFAAFLYLAERLGNRSRRIDELTVADSLWVGMSQALALLPGVSRSGITIGTSMLRDVDREASARFSFLLSTPVIVGAALLQGWHLFEAVHTPLAYSARHGMAAGTVAVRWDVLALGIASAAITGFFCIRYFLRFIQTRSFMPFVIYRILLAAAVLLLYFKHGI